MAGEGEGVVRVLGDIGFQLFHEIGSQVCDVVVVEVGSDGGVIDGVKSESGVLALSSFHHELPICVCASERADKDLFGVVDEHGERHSVTAADGVLVYVDEFDGGFDGVAV